ncbi:hypothetical protein GOV10_00600 [Candidatus Woesearchaeota archaeon]|nr:hypothetical protein [Candidatus Woesearchaeota archaeon]
MELEKILDISPDIVAQLSTMGLSVREIEDWFDTPLPTYEGLTPAEYIAENGPDDVYKNLLTIYHSLSCL